MAKSIIDQLAEDTAPKNFSEFELGMVLAALVNEINQECDDFDPQIFDSMVAKAPEVLEYWRKKYADEINLFGKTGKSSHNR